jgi:hypothetical protein
VKTTAVKPLALVALLIAGLAAPVAAHDLFLKPFRYFVAPRSEARVRVLNGTFEKSENSIERNRIRDLSIVGPDGVQHPDTGSWADTGDTSVFTFRTGAPGTYVIGASTLPRTLRLEGKAFNEYLASDGVPDVLEARRRAGEMDRPSHERYSKHVKSVLQAGDARTGGFDTPLGYPAEILPLENPYAVKIGGTLRVRAMVDGKPVANQLVVAGGRTPTGARLHVQNTRSGADGIARVQISDRGFWYIKFIHMVPVTGDSVTYESKWATLTFEAR